MATDGLTRIMPDESWRVLYHEAGHGVVAVRHRMVFEYVEVRENDWGEVPPIGGPLAHPDRTHSTDEIARWQLFYAAGAAAEMLFFGNWREHGAQIDVERHGRLERMRRIPRQDAWGLDIQAAMKVLDRASVVALAEELNCHKKLDVERVYALLRCETPW